MEADAAVNGDIICFILVLDVPSFISSMLSFDVIY